MIDHPRLTESERGEPAIAVTLDPSDTHNFAEPTRRTLTLSTKGAALLVDDLGYDEREEVARVTARVLILTGGAYVPDETVDAVEMTQRLRCPNGGKHPTDAEIHRVAAYLKAAEIEERARWLAEEIVDESRLATVMDPEEIRTQRERMNGLRGIAKDL